MQWYDWLTLLLILFYVVLCSDLAWKATGQAAKELYAESMPPLPPRMTITQAIIYGEMLLSADEKSDQQQYYEEL